MITTDTTTQTRQSEAPTRALYRGLESEMGLKFGKIDESFLNVCRVIKISIFRSNLAWPHQK